MFGFKKHTSVNRVFTLILVYRKQHLGIQEVSQLMQYLPSANSIDTLAGDFNYVFLKVTENKLLDIFTDHVRIVNKTTHLAGSLIDHVYIKKNVGRIFCERSC